MTEPETLRRSCIEIPLFFQAKGETLFGVFSEPQREDNGVGVILAQGGSPNMVAFQRNRLGARLARELAALGYTVLRFDYHGLGDSTGEAREFRLDRPFVEDLEAAGRLLAERGFRRLVVVSSCFGARTALAAAPRLPGLEGIVLAAIFLSDELRAVRADELSLGHYLKRTFRLANLRRLRDGEVRTASFRIVRGKARALVRRLLKSVRHADGRSGETWWLSSDVARQLRALVELEVQVLFLFGTEDPSYRLFRQASISGLGELLEAYSDRIEIGAEIEGSIHGYTSLTVQAAFLDAVRTWLQRRAPVGTTTG